MSDSEEMAPEGHGVHGTQREDGKMQEEPEGADDRDPQAEADATDTGGDAT